MDADEFARLCRAEKDSMVAAFFDPTAGTAVGSQIDSLGLDDAKLATARSIVDGALTDALYNFLVALDGGASLGGVQQTYDLRDESGAKLTGDGSLESAAFAAFHESDT
ncbi:hypothetical protein [Rhodopirellula bahusiensis]|uniref:hypothetical protein n=1 Tax=Rhodopirellula bahusiensis TaxID=2014065 RepID=UPI003267B4F1